MAPQPSRSQRALCVDRPVWPAALTAMCGLGLGISWFGVADRGVVADQLGWLTAGVLALIAASYVEASAIVRRAQAVRSRRASLVASAGAAMDSLLDQLPHHELQTNAVESDEVRVGPSSSLYHRPGCVMASGRGAESMDLALAEARGLEPCGICLHRPAPFLTSEEVSR